MNWDEKADEGAIKHYSDWCPDGTLKAHRRGARWQRNQLRTPEAIERMAVVIYEAEDPLANAGWAFESEDLKNTYREWAKDQITGLLGED